MFNVRFFENLYRFPPYLSALVAVVSVVVFLMSGSAYALLYPFTGLILVQLCHRHEKAPLAFLPDPIRITLAFLLILGVTGMQALGGAS